MRWLSALLVVFLLSSGLTPASAKEYISSEAERIEIQHLTDTYLKLLDDRHYAAAYAMQSESLRALAPFPEWFAFIERSRQELGTRLERTQTRTSWYLDPPDSPGPGLYVAVDFQSRYANARQHSEYLVWLRTKKADTFMLTRHETTIFMDSAVAQAGTHASSDKQSVQTPEPQPPPLPEAKGDVIGFPTVEAARIALSGRQDAKVRTMEDGWLVIEDMSDKSVWSFTPTGHPAHPAVVKRYVYEQDGSVMLGMNALCQAGKSECDRLIRQFQEMNRKAGQSVQGNQ